MNKVKKLLILVGCMLFVLVGCASDEEVAGKFVNSMDTLVADRIPTNEEVSKLRTKYDKMTEEQKKLVPAEKRQELSKLEKIDFSELQALQGMIDEFSKEKDLQNSLNYAGLGDIYKKYYSFSEEEKAYINADIFDEILALEGYEGAATAACNLLKNSLKYPDSLELTSLRVKKSDTSYGDYYYVSINYRAQNDFGMSMKDVAAVDLSEKNDGSFEKGTLISIGGFSKSMNNYVIQAYLLCDGDTVEVDVEKVMNTLTVIS